LALGGLCLPSPGHARSTANPAIGEAAPIVSQGSVAPARIAAQTEFLRALLAVDMANASRAIPADDLRIVSAAFGPPAQDRDILVNWLMRGGQAFATREGLSGIYNPLADAWLLLGWRPVGADARLVWAALVEGEVLREAGQPDWSEGQGALGNELERAADQSSAAFLAIPETLGTGGLVELVETYRGLQGALVLDRVRDMGGALASWSAANPAALQRLRVAIERKRDKALRELPDPVRESLSPMAALTGPDGVILVLQSPIDPSRTILVRIGEGRAGMEFSAADLRPDRAPDRELAEAQ